MWKFDKNNDLMNQIGLQEVLIVEDHPIVSRGVHVVLARHFGRISNVVEARSVSAAEDALQKIKFQLAIVDLGLPDKNGLTLVQQLRESNPKCKVLLLTSEIRVMQLQVALSLKIRAIVLKQQLNQTLAIAVEALLDGETYYPPSLQLDIKQATALSSVNVQNQLKKLTKTEKTILQLIAKGKTTGTIASELYNSPNTIKKHRFNICRKLNLDQKNYSLMRFAQRFHFLLQ